MEAHRAEFGKLCDDDARYAALAEALFDEECLAPLRFTAAEVESAFKHIGYPAIMRASEEQRGEFVEAAILHIADSRRRELVSMHLLLLLPEFVNRGRYLEGWVIVSVAEATIEEQDESNPFLFQMFSYGYETWVAENQKKYQDTVRQLGIAPEILQDMDLNKFHSWLESQSANPERARMLETCFRQYLRFREEWQANFLSIAHNIGKLLDRKDSVCLLLRPDEVWPWLQRLSDPTTLERLCPEPPSEAKAHDAMQELLLPLLKEMADSTFTPARLGQLLDELKKYRHDLTAIREKAAAAHAMGAMTFVDGENRPGNNPFLLKLCWKSIEAAIG